MSAVDYVYRFDPRLPSRSKLPIDAEEARLRLEEGNRKFAAWMAQCQSDKRPTKREATHIVDCGGLDWDLLAQEGGVPKQAPFAAVIGCSDSRVPTEMIFGQGFNDLFVIRVAGNVLGDVCQGSIDFAVEKLNESLKVIVVLGHSGCGAVNAAVDAYLHPAKFWSRAFSPELRLIQQKIFVAVRESANMLDEVWGPGARNDIDRYAAALIETAVCINAAQTAFLLRQSIESSCRWNIQVYFGVFNLSNFQVAMPNRPDSKPAPNNYLAEAPSNPREFSSLARYMAGLLKLDDPSAPPQIAAKMIESNRRLRNKRRGKSTK